jgi:hypothetical protein
MVPVTIHPRTDTAAGWDLSDEDMKFLEQAQKDVQKYVEALPTESSLRAKGFTEDQIKNAETKEKFDREVERLSKMSEEDLLKEIEKAITDASTTQPAPEPQVQPSKPVVPEAPAAKPTPAANAKHHAALQLIDLTITGITNFLRKAQIMVELPSKIQTWQKDGKLRNWPTSLSWNSFRTQVEELEAKLHKLKDRDPKSNNYRYLDDFIKDEGTYNNIIKLRDSLTKNESKIALSPFGMDKMTSESREATRTILLSLHEALSILGIPAGLDRIFEKYEPTAKKIKESEEAAQKKAFEQSKMPRYAEPMRVGGSGKVARDLGSRDRDRGGDRYRTSDSYDSYGRPAQKTEDTKKSSLSAPGGAGAAGAKAGDDAKKSAAAKQEDQKAKYEADKKADRFEGTFLESIGNFGALLDELSVFKNIDKHINIEKAAPVNEEVVSAIKTGSKLIGTATTAVKNLKKQLNNLNEAQKKAYKKSIKDTYKDVRSDLDKLNNQIANLEKPDQARQLAMIPNQREKNTFMSKYFAYFGRKYESYLQKIVDDARKGAGANPLPADIRRIEDLLNKPSVPDLSELRTKIQELHKTVDGL